MNVCLVSMKGLHLQKGLWVSFHGLGVLGGEPVWCGTLSVRHGCTLLCPLSHQLQFVLTIIQTSCGVIWSCTFPLGWLYFQIGYMISLITLFTNFYIQVSLALPWQLGLVAFSAKNLLCSFKEDDLWKEPLLRARQQALVQSQWQGNPYLWEGTDCQHRRCWYLSQTSRVLDLRQRSRGFTWERHAVRQALLLLCSQPTAGMWRESSVNSPTAPPPWTLELHKMSKEMCITALGCRQKSALSSPFPHTCTAHVWRLHSFPSAGWQVSFTQKGPVRADCLHWIAVWLPVTPGWGVFLPPWAACSSRQVPKVGRQGRGHGYGNSKVREVEQLLGGVPCGHPCAPPPPFIPLPWAWRHIPGSCRMGGVPMWGHSSTWGRTKAGSWQNWNHYSNCLWQHSVVCIRAKAIAEVPSKSWRWEMGVIERYHRVGENSVAMWPRYSVTPSRYREGMARGSVLWIFYFISRIALTLQPKPLWTSSGDASGREEWWKPVAENVPRVAWPQTLRLSGIGS